MTPLTEVVNKALIPVNDKPIITHIIEKFDKSIEIIIAVGYLKDDLVDYITLVHGDRKISIVEIDNYDRPGSGPGYSILKCKKFLNCPFIFYAVDTFVDEEIPFPTFDWMGVDKVNESKDYCSINSNKDFITRLYDKKDLGKCEAFIGIAGVYSYEIFFENIESYAASTSDEVQVIPGFQALIKSGLKKINFSWSDIGNLDSYHNLCSKYRRETNSFDFSKTDEYLYFVENNVIKFFTNKEVAIKRCIRAKKLEGLVPKNLICKNRFYKYEMVEGGVLYETDTANLITKFFDWAELNLWKIKKLPSTSTESFKKQCNNFYYNKTLSRIAKLKDKNSQFDKFSAVNGIKVPTIEKILDSIDWEELSNGVASLFHGDLQFDNIILNDKKNFFLIDWRDDFAGNIDYGDMYYDLAKLYGGMLVSYKDIKSNLFNVSFEGESSITLDYQRSHILDATEKKFVEIIIKKKLDLKKIKILTGLIFLNMSPMHHYPFDIFIYNLGKLQLKKILNL